MEDLTPGSETRQLFTVKSVAECQPICTGSLGPSSQLKSVHAVGYIAGEEPG